MRIFITVAAAAAALTLASSNGSAGFCANPASNFSAYYYQSPGGVGRAHRARASGRVAYRAHAVRYDRCGGWRAWRGDYCAHD